jgi:hypothetical protein
MHPGFAASTWGDDEIVSITAAKVQFEWAQMPAGCSADGELLVPPIIKITNTNGKAQAYTGVALFLSLDYALTTFPVDTLAKIGTARDISQVAEIPLALEQSMTMGFPVAFVFSNTTLYNVSDPSAGKWLSSMGKDHGLYKGGVSPYLMVTSVTNATGHAAFTGLRVNPDLPGTYQFLTGAGNAFSPSSDPFVCESKANEIKADVLMPADRSEEAWKVIHECMHECMHERTPSPASNAERM